MYMLLKKYLDDFKKNIYKLDENYTLSLHKRKEVYSMDAQSFAMFLKDEVMKKSKQLDGPLLSASYDNISTAQRAAGQREAFLAVAQGIDGLLKQFTEQGFSVVHQDIQDV